MKDWGTFLFLLLLCIAVGVALVLVLNAHEKGLQDAARPQGKGTLSVFESWGSGFFFGLPRIDRAARPPSKPSTNAPTVKGAAL